MIAAIGAMLRAAEKRLVILVDGFIMTSCAIAAIRLYPTVQDYMIFTHCGDERGHKRMLDTIGARPLLSLGMRLGEGSGAVMLLPLLDGALAVYDQDSTFDSFGMEAYTPQEERA